MKRLLRSFLSAGVLAALALSPGRAFAVTQTYCSFPAGLATWTYNQNAFEALNSVIRLTDAVANETGSAWLASPIPIAAATSVNAYFRIQMGPNAAGGDGIAFVMQNSAAGAAALGTGTTQMGYGGITPSVVIQFNTFKNDANDPNANNVSLMLNGVATAVPTATGTPAFTMAGGGILSAWVQYDGVGKTISVYVAQSATKPALPIFTHALNLFTQLGAQMYVGFTSATGASPEINEHDVYELEISTSGIPCACEGDPACGGATPACSASSGLCAVCSATNHTACTGATPVCDVPTNTCVGCLTNADCSGATPICDGGTLTCRACNNAADCSSPTPQCDTIAGSASLGKCVVCVADANCPPGAPRCNLATNTCTQCLSAADCGGDTPVCTAGKCQPCGSDADCGGATPACEVWGACGQCSSTNASKCTGGTAVCDFPTGTCVACEFNSDCAGMTPTCNPATHMCEPCMSNADCVGNPGGPACVTSGMKAGSCVICEQDSDCTSPAAPKCDSVANLCVACLSNADCSAPTPVCSASNLCVGCLANSDCSGATPVCNTATSTCTGCQNDYAMSNPGPLSCPTPALPACQPAGSALAGQCTVCSSLNGSVCITQATTPVCVDPMTTPTCGCLQDSDCNAGNYCDVSMVSTGVCTPGCRVVGADGGMGGVTNCPTGQYCTKMDGTVGTCMAEPCNSNTDCKAPNPVCNTIAQPHSCVQCLNDPDCASPDVCDSMNTCVECTSNQTQNCSAAGKGAACLANETCGCTMDSDCGGPTSGRVCDPTMHTCTTGCRGTGGNGCAPPDTCSSKDNTIGQCTGPGTTASATAASSSSSSGADAGPGTGGGGPAGAHLVSASQGCGCRVASSEDDAARAFALAGAVAALALARRRRSRRGTRQGSPKPLGPRDQENHNGGSRAS